MNTVETSIDTASTPVATLHGCRDRERIYTVVVDDPEDLAIYLADRITTVIHEATAARGSCVLGLATGSTPIGIYRELIRRHQAGELDFAKVVTFNLDEYYPMEPDNIHSYNMFMMENFFSQVNIDPSNIHIPDGSVKRSRIHEHCAAYEQAIVDAGGIDFQILGIGRSGHIGFNEPGSSLLSRTRAITLDTITRRDAAADFFGEDNVPTEAITMGIATILDAREIALIATGEHKADIVRRAVEEEISADVTATFLQEHGNTSVYLDAPAAADLTRIKTPWVLEPVEWDKATTERAVVWLAGQSKKAILKLTDADYRENHLSTLLSLHGFAGKPNGEVFNRLSKKIRGRKKLAAKKRVLVFSPHPDDDVISMGGILRKLQQNENEIIVAYMTSGNIAVFDHDVLRHLDFVERATATLGLSTDRVRQKRKEVKRSFAKKHPGAVDSDSVLNLKRFIRESEAISAIVAVGLPAAAARFLNLPFYQTGEVRKRPVGEEDVKIVNGLLSEFKPDIVFVAGDMSDPHGTHRMCKAAIDRALDKYDGRHPEVWLYRGAWEEWPLTEADVLVPLSQEEVHQKIMAIFKHQSQKDVAPFPGGHDDREFWQRVETRNLETAVRADRLGLPEYYAMEAYRIEGKKR